MQHVLLSVVSIISQYLTLFFEQMDGNQMVNYLMTIYVFGETNKPRSVSNNSGSLNYF